MKEPEAGGDLKKIFYPKILKCDNGRGHPLSHPRAGGGTFRTLVGKAGNKQGTLTIIVKNTRYLACAQSWIPAFAGMGLLV